MKNKRKGTKAKNKIRGSANFPFREALTALGGKNAEALERGKKKERSHVRTNEIKHYLIALWSASSEAKVRELF